MKKGPAIPFAGLNDLPLTAGDRIVAAMQTLQELDGHLTPGQRRALAQMAGDVSTPFDLQGEVKAQYSLVQALRENLVNPFTNKLKEGYDTRDAREMVTAFTSFLSLYLKAQEKIDKETELGAIEAAFVETVKAMPEQAQKTYLAELERRLRSLA